MRVQASCAMAAAIGFAVAAASAAMTCTGEITRVDLAHPSRMSEDRVRLHKYHLSSASEKNKNWARKTGSLSDYGYRTIYGLEADAMTWEELTAVFDQEASPYLTVPREQASVIR